MRLLALITRLIGVRAPRWQIPNGVYVNGELGGWRATMTSELNAPSTLETDAELPDGALVEVVAAHRLVGVFFADHGRAVDPWERLVR